MRTFTQYLCMILMFPLDLVRLTIDAWRFTLESTDFHADQPCIYCRGCDTSEGQRVMFHQIRYWNLWMPRLLHPELRKAACKSQLRPVPVCHREGGYLDLPRHIPLLALGLSGLWTVLIVWLCLKTGMVPPEVLGGFRSGVQKYADSV